MALGRTAKYYRDNPEARKKHRGEVENMSWSLQKRTGVVKLIHLETEEQEVKKEKEEKIKVILKTVNNGTRCSYRKRNTFSGQKK